MKIFTVYDSKAQAYIQPFFAVNQGTALRSFATAANDQQHDFNRYAADFTLFLIGEWEPTSGHITLHESKINLGMASEFITGAPK